MLGISTSERIAHKVESQFKPHWLASDRPSNDVARPTPALPLYEWLAGQEVPEILAVETVKNQIKVNELADWRKNIEPIKDIVNLINPIAMDEHVANQILSAVRECDLQSANSLFEEHIKNVVSNLGDSLQAHVERTIKALPNGDCIFNEIGNEPLYELCLESDGDDDFVLSIESNSFFEHFYADVESVPEKYRAYYALLLKNIMRGSFGELQNNVIEYYGSVDPVSVECQGIIMQFIAKLGECEIEPEINEVLSEYNKCVTVQHFLSEVEEIILYGDDIVELLKEDHESAMNCLDEGAELMEFAVKYKSVMDFGEMTLDSLLNAEDDGSAYMALFKAIGAAFFSMPVCESAITLKEERTTFGIIISALSEKDVTEEIERRLQNLYEGFMSNGEDSEAWIIDVKNPHWKQYVTNCALSLSLVLAMICGVQQIQKVA